MNPNNKELYEFYKQNLHILDTKFRPNDEQVTFDIRDKIITPYESQIYMAKNRIMTIIKSYMSKNASKLGARYPTSKIPFLKSDMEILFSACKIPKELVYNESIKINANDIDTGNHLIQEPFNMMCTIAIHVFLKRDKNLQKQILDIMKGKHLDDKIKYSSPVYFITLYLAVHFYSALYNKFWKYDPNEDVMDYTIEHMSNKFIIRKCQNILEFITYHSETNVENMLDRLLRASDVDLIYFYSNLNNRISHALRTIANNYYENKEKGNTVDHENANRKNEEGKFFVGDTTSITADVEQTTRRITTRFFSESVLNDQLVTASCARTKFSKAKFILIIQKIRENHDNDPIIRDIIAGIISYYLITFNGKIENLKSNPFLLQMFKAYAISNTKDKFVLDTKAQLDKLIRNNLQGILDEMNQNLLDRARVSIYQFLVLYIAANSK